ncbi:MAG: sigma-54-dependent Fis family transcriptional regulator [candidate division NC10 bacterium RBG_16_65_8]|nr:MAG: sigma-54-dependent Fis family transcriptional regulator [candidate division NC10 bacterium RBG_16_65_8]
MNAPAPARESILVVDDAPETLEVLRRNLESEGHRVFAAPGVAEALAVLETTPIDLVITDYKMPKVSGLDLVRHVRENLQDTEVVMITGYASIEGAIEAIKTGAEEYLSKPFTDEELFEAVRRALEKRSRRRIAAPATASTGGPLPGFIGQSEAMQRVYAAIRKAAETTATVLITGESGTGKELVARAIHYGSRRSAAPFVAVNCGGIPEGLIESELFGHMKGAFTGAVTSRAGFFLTADGGTIFLDEISEISLPLQVKFLRVLQDKVVYMVGASHPRQVDVRIVAATNKNLRTLVERQVFREDLFFRLNVIPIEVPPLRERGDDVLLLARYFVEKFSRELGRPIPRLSDALLASLVAYPWPGNVRELENIVQRVVVMVEGEEIDVPSLPVSMRFSAPRTASIHRPLAEVEAEHVRAVLASVDDNKTVAAKILGIDRKTLREKLKHLGVADP